MIQLLLWAESFGRQAVPFALNYVWQSALVIVIAAGTAYLLRGTRAADRRAVWLTALFVCLLLPITSPLVRRLGVEQPFLPGLDLDDPAVLGSGVRMLRLSAVRPRTNADERALDLHPNDTVRVPPLPPSGWLAVGNVTKALRETPVTAPRRESVVVDMLYVCCGALYALGIAWFALRFGAGTAWLGWVRFCARPLQRPDLDPILRDLCRVLNLRRAPEVLVSRHVNSPSVFGMASPTIIIPSVFGTWLTSLQLRQVLAHEMTHIKSRDYLCGMLFRTAQVWLFCQPLLSHVINQLRAEAEFLADDVAVSLGRKIGQDPVAYAELLVSMAELSRPSYAEKFAATALIPTPSQLARRVDAILASDAHPHVRITPRRRMLYRLCGLLILAVMSSTTIIKPSVSSAGFLALDLESEQTALPALHTPSAFTFDVERILGFPADSLPEPPRGMAWDQEQALVTITGGPWLHQFVLSATGNILERVAGPTPLPEAVEAVTLVEPSLALRAVRRQPWATRGALALSPVSGREIWFFPRDLRGLRNVQPVRLAAPAPQTNAPVSGLTSLVDTEIPGDLGRVTSANAPGQIDLLHLRSETPDAEPRFERHISAYNWDLRELERNGGIVAPLRGVAYDMFEEMLYVVDAGNPEPYTPPGGRVQAFSYTPGLRRDRNTGPFYRRYWSALIDYQIALAGGHWSEEGAMLGFEEIAFSRTGERMAILYEVKNGPPGSPVSAGLAILKRPHLNLMLSRTTLAVGETIPVAILASESIPQPSPMRFVSSDPEIASVQLGPAHAETEGKLREGTVTAHRPGTAVLGIFCADLPGTTQRIVVHAERRQTD